MTDQTDDGATGPIPIQYVCPDGTVRELSAEDITRCLQANTALRAEVLGKLGAAEYGKTCDDCGAQWMHDITLDKLSDMTEERVGAMREKLRLVESELAEAKAKTEQLAAMHSDLMRDNNELSSKVIELSTELAAERARVRELEALAESWRHSGAGATRAQLRDQHESFGRERIDGLTPNTHEIVR
jgi:septal ring factor EnvC (AmiA/AmiB activator)